MTPFIFDRSIPGKLESWPYNIKFAKNTTQKLYKTAPKIVMTNNDSLDMEKVNCMCISLTIH